MRPFLLSLSRARASCDACGMIYTFSFRTKITFACYITNMTLEELYRKHNADTRPFYRQMRSLSESDVIVVKRSSKRNAYYVDAVGFQEVPSFLKGLQKLKERGEAR